MENPISEKGEAARFYQVTAPSRSGNPDYQYLQSLLDSQVEKLNKTLGEGAIIRSQPTILSARPTGVIAKWATLLITALLVTDY